MRARRAETRHVPTSFSNDPTMYDRILPMYARKRRGRPTERRYGARAWGGGWMSASWWERGTSPSALASSTLSTSTPTEPTTRPSLNPWPKSALPSCGTGPKWSGGPGAPVDSREPKRANRISSGIPTPLLSRSMARGAHTCGEGAPPGGLERRARCAASGRAVRSTPAASTASDIAVRQRPLAGLDLSCSPSCIPRASPRRG